MTTNVKTTPAPGYRIWSEIGEGDDAWYPEGYRTWLADAFMLARRRFREYHGSKRIKVTTFSGGLIADDISDFTMRRTRTAKER